MGFDISEKVREWARESDQELACDSTINWVQIRAIIDEAIKKRDRSVSIYLSPENGMSVNVYPWPDYEDLYEMYKDGKVTFTDFRTKAGLPMIKEEDFIRSSQRFNIQNAED